MHAPNRRATAVGAAALLLATAAVAAVPSSASAANILTNPGFETGTLSGWSCSGGLGSVVSTPVHGGSKALAGAASASDNAKCAQTVAVQPNTTYSLSSWVRGNYVYLGVTGGASTWTPAAADWKQLTVSFTTGASQTSAEVYLNGWFGQGTYYADDISLDGPGGGTPDTQAPTAPTGLAATATAATQVSLSWGASSDNVGVTGYDVYRNGALATTVTGTTATVTGLSAGTSYTFTVKAHDAAGNASAASNSLSVTTPSGGDQQAPTAPTNLVATATAATQVSLSWGASSDNVGVTAYDVYRNGTLATSVTGTTATVTGLTASTAYTFTVKARDAAGNASAASNALAVTTPPTTTPSGFKQAAPYLYNGWGNPPAATTVMNATGVKWFTLAFVLAQNGCNPTWDSQRPLLGGVDQQTINAVRAAGGDVVPSFGGWSGNKLGPNCADATALAGAYQKVIDAYSLKAIDIDIENTDEFEKLHRPGPHPERAEDRQAEEPRHPDDRHLRHLDQRPDRRRQPADRAVQGARRGHRRLHHHAVRLRQRVHRHVRRDRQRRHRPEEQAQVGLRLGRRHRLRAPGHLRHERPQRQQRDHHRRQLDRDPRLGQHQPHRPPGVLVGQPRPRLRGRRPPGDLLRHRPVRLAVQLHHGRLHRLTHRRSPDGPGPAPRRPGPSPRPDGTGPAAGRTRRTERARRAGCQSVGRGGPGSRRWRSGPSGAG